MSSSRTPRTGLPYSSAVQYRFACVCTVPFGLPVEPDEYSQKPMSSAAVGAAAGAGACRASQRRKLGRLNDALDLVRCVASSLASTPAPARWKQMRPGRGCAPACTRSRQGVSSATTRCGRNGFARDPEPSKVGLHWSAARHLPDNPPCGRVRRSTALAAGPFFMADKPRTVVARAKKKAGRGVSTTGQEVPVALGDDRVVSSRGSVKGYFADVPQ